jgi:hypothetical protein
MERIKALEKRRFPVQRIVTELDGRELMQSLSPRNPARSRSQLYQAACKNHLGYLSCLATIKQSELPGA